MISKLAKAWLAKHDRIDKIDLVTHLVLHTANLELSKQELVEFAPVQGTCGPIQLTGTVLPVFTYLVFEKKLMEFIKVSVEIAKPDRIDFVCTIESKNTQDPSGHGTVVSTESEYTKPFWTLSKALYSYFPIARKDPRYETAPVIQVQSQGAEGVGHIQASGQDCIH